MKCKHCNGTGTTNWCVNGTFVDCPYCGGTGEMEMEMTNEEWFCQLSTEEKARFIADNDGTIQIGDEVDYKNTITKWLEWLKQPHTDKE